MRIRLAESDSDIAVCFPIMSQLRTHIAEGEFVERGYRLAYLEEGGRAVAVEGHTDHGLDSMLRKKQVSVLRS